MQWAITDKTGYTMSLFINNGGISVSSRNDADGSTQWSMGIDTRPSYIKTRTEATLTNGTTPLYLSSNEYFPICVYCTNHGYRCIPYASDGYWYVDVVNWDFNHVSDKTVDLWIAYKRI